MTRYTWFLCSPFAKSIVIISKGTFFSINVIATRLVQVELGEPTSLRTIVNDVGGWEGVVYGWVKTVQVLYIS